MPLFTCWSDTNLPKISWLCTVPVRFVQHGRSLMPVWHPDLQPEKMTITESSNGLATVDQQPYSWLCYIISCMSNDRVALIHNRIDQTTIREVMFWLSETPEQSSPTRPGARAWETQSQCPPKTKRKVKLARKSSSNPEREEEDVKKADRVDQKQRVEGRLLVQLAVPDICIVHSATRWRWDEKKLFKFACNFSQRREARLTLPI